MAKKAKKSRKQRKAQRPPLCGWDELTYGILLILNAAALTGMILGTIGLHQHIAFADPGVLASTENISTLWALVPFMALMFVTFIPLYHAYTDRKPIWGPKEPPAYISPRQKSIRKYGMLFMWAMVLICLIPYPWSLYGRTSIRADGSIVRYNMFNQQTAVCASDEIADLCIEAFIQPVGKYSRSWVGGMQVVLTTDQGKEYVFDHEDFCKNAAEKHGWLNAMAKLKTQYPPESVHCGGLDLLERVIEDQNLTEKEAEQLRRLLGGIA